MNDEMKMKMDVAPVHYGLGLGLGLVVWHAGAGSLVIDYSWSVELLLFIFILVGRSPLRGAFRLGEREVQADDSKRWVSEVLGRVHAAGPFCCLV